MTTEEAREAAGRCAQCGHPYERHDSPGGVFYSHVAHPSDDHDALPMTDARSASQALVDFAALLERCRALYDSGWEFRHEPNLEEDIMTALEVAADAHAAGVASGIRQAREAVENSVGVDDHTSGDDIFFALKAIDALGGEQ